LFVVVAVVYSHYPTLYSLRGGPSAEATCLGAHDL